MRRALVTCALFLLAILLVAPAGGCTQTPTQMYASSLATSASMQRAGVAYHQVAEASGTSKADRWKVEAPLNEAIQAGRTAVDSLHQCAVDYEAAKAAGSDAGMQEAKRKARLALADLGTAAARVAALADTQSRPGGRRSQEAK
jgi:hypothetical protein